jgi:hypothetical protein
MVDVFTAPRNALFPGKATRKAPLESDSLSAMKTTRTEVRRRYTSEECAVHCFSTGYPEKRPDPET